MQQPVQLSQLYRFTIGTVVVFLQACGGSAYCSESGGSGSSGGGSSGGGFSGCGSSGGSIRGSIHDQQVNYLGSIVNDAAYVNYFAPVAGRHYRLSKCRV